MNWLKSKKTVVTHSGNFHADDVFAVALLSIIYNGQIKVMRTRDESFYPKADFVVDTGLEYDPDRNRFDHHQEGNAGFRDNKISYSSFGLLWKKYGEKVCGSKAVADILDKKLVEVVDANDCGFNLYKPLLNDVKPFVLSDMIHAFGPTWKETHLNIDDLFLKAVDFAKGILLREIKIAKHKAEAETLVDKAYAQAEDKRIIDFDENYWPRDLLKKYPEPLFVVYKDRMGKMWRVITIEKEVGSYESRKNFPKSWWGKSGADLAKASGVADAVFCRNGGVFVGVTSKEGAIQMAKLAVNANE